MSDASDAVWPDPFSPGVPVKIDIYEVGPDDEASRSPEHQAARYLADVRGQLTSREREYLESMDAAAFDLTLDQLRVFTGEYAVNHDMRSAAAEAGAPLAVFMHRMELDGVFARMVQTARRIWLAELESTAMDRATGFVELEKSGAANDILKYMAERIAPTPPPAKSKKGVIDEENDIRLRVEQPVDLSTLGEEDQASLRALARKALGGG